MIRFFFFWILGLGFRGLGLRSFFVDGLRVVEFVDGLSWADYSLMGYCSSFKASGPTPVTLES